MKFSRLQRYLLSILSGLLMVISFPHTGSLFPLVFFAWVPLLLVEHNVYREKYKSSKVFIHAYLTFFIYNVGASYWIFYSIGGEAGAVLAYFLNGIIMALVFMLFHWTKKYVGQKEGYIGLPFFWIGFEYIHFHWELSWPWLNIGNTFAVIPEIVQWYAYTGILGGTMWILLLNMLIFKLVSNVVFNKETLKIQTPLIYLSLALIVIPSGLSYWSYATYEEVENPIEVVVTQPNVDPYNEKFSSDLSVGFIHQVLRLKIDTDGPSVIGGLVVDRAYRGRPEKIGKLISLSRFLYVGLNPDKFEKTIMSEMAPPLTDEGRSEFWEALGRRFTGMPYQEADVISHNNKGFIKSLFPEEDIYTCLLDSKARLVMGQVGDQTKPALHMLKKIGFSYMNEVDPFDGGPHFSVERDEISLVKGLKKAILTMDKVNQYDKNGIVSIIKEDCFYSFQSKFAFVEGRIHLPASAEQFDFISAGDEVSFFEFK